MFIPPGHAQARQPAEGKCAPPVPAREGAPSHEAAPNNPVWQSLATRPGALQPKLAVSQPGDAYEQEADRVADAVTESHASPTVAAAAPPRIQRFAGHTETAQPAALDGVDKALAGPGTPLDSTSRRDMERRFGQDFGQVRLHTDAAAAQSARDLKARAYTIGHDIVFGAGQSAPGTEQGRRLLAHELTHVVQQSAAGNQRAGHGVQRSPASNAGLPLVQRQPDTPSATPTPAPQPAAPAAAAPTQAAPAAPSTEGELSPIRQELLRLFTVFEKTIVGDEIFNGIITQEAWDKHKSDEAAATVEYDKKKKKYDEDKKKYDAEKKQNKNTTMKRPWPPIPVAKFTTCIATQTRLLTDAFANTKLSIAKASKTPRYDFATEGQKNAEKLGPGIWHEAKPNMPDTERPRPGDIIVLAFRGSKVDEAATALNYVVNLKYNTAQKIKTAERNQAKLADAEAANQKALEALAALEKDEALHTSKEYLKAEAALKRSITALNVAKTASDTATEAAEKAKAQSAAEAPAYQAKLDKARREADHKKFFQFSHVGFMRSIEKRPDGTERWTTFDGGQTVQSREQKQGAETVHRIYDPKINEISGEQSQGGTARWLQGWVDVDKLVAGPAPTKKTP